MTETASKIFREAADILRKRKWITGWWSPDGGRCLMGACAEASGVQFGEQDRFGLNHVGWNEWCNREFEAQAAALGFSSTYDAVNWNDSEGRTADEVIARLEAAACKLEPKEEI